MAKKLTDTVNDHDQQLAQAVRTSAQQIWQAGLGAFFKAQEEEQAAGGKAAGDGGEQAFQRLVEEGSVLQQRVRATADADQPAARHDAEGDADADAGTGARSWDKLEQVFEDRVVRALGAIGVPSKRDVDGLRQLIARLAEQVARLQAQLDGAGAGKDG
ncbi:phasin family protein [Massilia sp. DWR3-1-1]|uniref:phasin family protein n=1 Tax=Massilia sp. DWR3-1-1 TaxID=2804559 RepID=UPI003CF95349